MPIENCNMSLTGDSGFSKNKYDRNIQSKSELSDFVKRCVNEGVLSEEKAVNDLKPNISEVLQLENDIHAYRNMIKNVKEKGEEGVSYDKRKYGLRRAIQGFKHSTDSVSKLRELENEQKKKLLTPKSAENKDYYENNALASINSYVIDEVFVNEIKGLFKPDEWLINNTNMTPAMKLLEKDYTKKVKKMWTIMVSRNGNDNISDRDLKLIKREISIFN